MPKEAPAFRHGEYVTCAKCGADMSMIPEPMLGGFIVTWVCPVQEYH